MRSECWLPKLHFAVLCGKAVLGTKMLKHFSYRQLALLSAELLNPRSIFVTTITKAQE